MFFHLFGPRLAMPWYGWLPFILGNLFWLMIIGALIWLAVQLVRGPRGTPLRQVAAQPPISAMEVLRLRYVRGEIDAATFEEMRQRILASEQSPPTNI